MKEVVILRDEKNKKTNKGRCGYWIGNQRKEIIIIEHCELSARHYVCHVTL